MPSLSPSERPRTQRLGAAWFWCLLGVLVLGAGVAIWHVQHRSAVRVRHAEQRLGAQRLGEAVGQVLTDQRHLAATLGASRVPLGRAWATFSAPLLADAATDSVGLVVPVPAAARASWTAAHHRAILLAEGAGHFRPAPARSVYWVLDRVATKRGSTMSQLGIDLSENPTRAAAMIRALHSSMPQATGPIRFLDETRSRYGVLSFQAIRRPGGAAIGWVVTSIEAGSFAEAVAQSVPGARVAVELGGRFLLRQPQALTGLRLSHVAGGQRWTTYIWVPRHARSLVPWLVLALLALGVAVVRAALVNSHARESYALDLVEHHVSELRERNDELEHQRRSFQESEAFLGRVFDHAPFPKVVLDLRGLALRVNQAMCDLCACEEADLLDRPLTLLIDPRDRAADHARLSDTLAGRREGYRAESRMIARDGSIHVVDASVSLVRDDSGRPAYAVTQLCDVTEQRHSQDELARAHQHAEAITQAMAEGYTLTRDGEIVAVNDALCEMLGYSRDELVGTRQPYGFWAPETRHESVAIREAVLARGGGTFETRLIRRTGEIFAAEMTARPARAADGSLIGLVTTVRDVSERRRHEAELERERQELYHAQALARVGSWDTVREPVRHRRWSPELWRIAGLEPVGTAPPEGTLLKMIHREDRERIERVSAVARATQQPWNDEFRIINAQGQLVHVAVSVMPDHAADGSVFTRGTVQDITDRARRDAEEIALRHIAELVAQAPASRAVFDEVSRRSLELFGASSAYVARYEHDRGVAVCVAGETDTGHRLEGLQFTLDESENPDGEARYASLTGEAMVDPALLRRLADGHVHAPIVVGARVWGRLAVTVAGEGCPADLDERLRRFASLIAMAIANAETSDQLKRQALTDALTGLLNRRALSTLLRREIGVSERTGHALSLAIIDLDHFKAVNDRYGHQCGDAVLAEFARRLRAAAGPGDAIARLGGEEFAWLMPNCDAAAARQVLEDFAEGSRTMPFSGAGVVTMSAGVHAYGAGEGIATLLRAADDAVYEAKAAGRDRVVISATQAPVVAYPAADVIAAGSTAGRA